VADFAYLKERPAEPSARQDHPNGREIVLGMAGAEFP